MAHEFIQGVHLRRTQERVDEIEALAALCGGRVGGVSALLADSRTPGRRRMHRSLPTGRKVAAAWRWEKVDNRTARWWPQGITTSADAFASTRLDGREVIAVSWYSKQLAGYGKGTRISFIDFLGRHYRHVLLVVPKIVDGEVELEPLHAHAGGIVWAGDHLYVAGTRKGIYAFRLDDLMRIPGSRRVADHERIGRDGERIATYGYRYVLPLLVPLARPQRRDRSRAGRRRVRPAPAVDAVGPLPARPRDLAAPRDGGRLLPAAAAGGEGRARHAGRHRR